MKPEQLAQTIARRLLGEYENEHTAQSNAWALLEHIIGTTREQLIIKGDVTLSADESEALEHAIEDITSHHKPLHYIIGSVPFLNVTLQVEPPVLIPRPETESWCAQLIERLAKSNIKNIRILDLCTGSGCIALALAKALPESFVVATDISEQALALAQKNAYANDITNIRFVSSDVYKSIGDAKFDLIVANPPYITPQEFATLEATVKNWEDPHALVAANQGLEILATIVQEAPAHLNAWQYDVPQLWIEIGYTQAAAVCEIFEKAGFKPEVLKDLAGNDRVVAGRLKNKNH